jgi:putative ABC transport system substrate-binding protein
MLTLGVLVAPRGGAAQQAARPVTIGVLCAGMCPFAGPVESYRPLTDALARIGLVEGRTLKWDFGGVVTSEDQLTVEARKLVARQPTFILVWPGNVIAALAVKEATRTIPIVLMAALDVVEHGLVASLARPGANITGMSVPMYDLIVKQLQVLKEINPRLHGVIVVHGDLDRGDRQNLDRLRGAAASLRLDGGISVAEAGNLEQALGAAPVGVTGALVIGNIPHVIQRRVRVLTLERKLPLLMPWRAWAGGGSGLLITYAPRFVAVAERTAAFVDRIIKGARPGDLPVEEPTSYELIIDGVMAKALGLTIPAGVRARADEVLE